MSYENRTIFISHASKDDGFVKELRVALEGVGLEVWGDLRELSGGSKVSAEIEEAIERARQFVAVLSPNTVNSPWVRAEIKKALEVEGRRKAEGYRVVPLLLGLGPPALELWFDEEPVSIPIEVTAGGISEALPALLAALGERLPDDPEGIVAVAPPPVEELVLELKDLKIETSDGKRRARAVAQLVYEPADPHARNVESTRFNFNAPLGVIEAEELRWYLEEFYVWPIGIFRERAARVEARMPEWGQDLYRAALTTRAAQETLDAWRFAGEGAERRFSIFVDSKLPEGASVEEQAAAGEAAAELLALPWELLHDGRGFLFHGPRPVRVRRRLPNRHRQNVIPTRLPIRILLVSPRPEEERASYLDHRISARPLIEAMESLGALAELTILTPPTFSALEGTLARADEAGEPYDVVHFDGHGVYDRGVGLGGLCFEDPNDVEKVWQRSMELVHAERLAEVIRDHRISLVFLEACQSAKTEEDPTSSVAARLLEEGVTSVVAMSHSVLAETARRFVRVFYGELAAGRRVGTAMLAGQRELERDTYRGRLMGAGELRLQDWFVPVLYQEKQDPQLVSKLPPQEVLHLQERQRRLNLGALPEPPTHRFIGRSRELLALERLLHAEPWAVIRGQGGEGKTTLAVELARWLVRTNRFERAAFVSLEHYTDARGVLDSLGRQLLPKGDGWSVANYPDLNQALQPVERALRDRATLVVLDNLECVLPDHTGQSPPGAAPVEELFDLCRKLLDAHPATRLVFTTREPLPAPFDRRRHEIVLGALAREDAVTLVGELMKQEGLTPKSDDPGADPREVVELVEAVDRHARALVLLARELARTGVRATTDNLRRLMADLHHRYPGDRENSLYASVDLSLRRLPPQAREQVKGLAVFWGGAHISVLAHVLGMSADLVGATAYKILTPYVWSVIPVKAVGANAGRNPSLEPVDRAVILEPFAGLAEAGAVSDLAEVLIEVGLAEHVAYGHLRLDPALPSYLLRLTSESEQEQSRSRWAEGMMQLTAFLYEQQFKDARIASHLTLLELPNLLAMLAWGEDRMAPEEVVGLARMVESLLSLLGRPRALEEATRVRERAARALGDWSRARYLAQEADVHRLLERGELQAAHAAAQKLLERSLAGGAEAYPGAAFDIARAYLTLGRVLNQAGAAEAALPLLAEAQRHFQMLADAGGNGGDRMASVAILEIGDSLTALGRLDEASAAYEEALRRAERVGDQRQVAISRFHLGTVYMMQQRYAQALGIYSEARYVFEDLGEPESVATTWHQIGRLYRHTRQFDQAERAYRQSLAIRVQQKNLWGEAGTLGELGNLYADMSRQEEAVKCFRQVADTYVKLKDQMHEGVVRSNLALTLLQMGQYDEARRELFRAVECKEPYGHAGEPWKTWTILHDLERASGNPEAAAQARQRAVESYLAYRRAGGQDMNTGAQLCALAAQAIAEGNAAELEQQLTEVLGADVPQSEKALISGVQAILCGDHNLALANDPNLEYDDAAELRLLLDVLNMKLDAPLSNQSSP